MVCKEIKPVNPKGNQFWIFIGRTGAEAETPILWPPDVKSWLIGKDPDAGKDWRQEEKGAAEDEMVGWHHQLNGHEFEKAPGVGDGQGSLTCCRPWDCKEWDMTDDWTYWMNPVRKTEKCWFMQDICEAGCFFFFPFLFLFLIFCKCKHKCDILWTSLFLFPYKTHLIFIRTFLGDLIALVQFSFFLYFSLKPFFFLFIF